MNIFSFKIDPRRKQQLRMISDVHTQIFNAIDEQKADSPDFTHQTLADEIGWDKGNLSRKLKATANLTISSIAEIAFALKRRPLLFLVKPDQEQAVKIAVHSICQVEPMTDNEHDRAQNDTLAPRTWGTFLFTEDSKADGISLKVSRASSSRPLDERALRSNPPLRAQKEIAGTAY